MAHRFPIRVFYEDTDMGGIVYHANYLRFVERARSDWVRSLGIDQNAMRDGGEIFVVTRIVADYLGPARFDEALEVETRLGAVTPARMTLAQEVRRDDALLFRAEVTIVLLGPSGRPARLPEALRRAVL